METHSTVHDLEINERYQDYNKRPFIKLFFLLCEEVIIDTST